MKKRILFVSIVALILCFFSIKTVTGFAANYSPATIVMDKTYIERSVVSETPIELTSDVRNSEKQRIWDAEVIYTVVDGNEFVEIKDGNKLYINAVGNYTIKAEVKGTSVIEEYTGTAYEVTFGNVVINNKFENVTIYMQPVKLVGDIDVIGIVAPTDCHYELVFKVVSGPAEIYSGHYLRVTGVGSVTIEAASRYDSSVKTTKTFNVTDPDVNKIIPEGTELKQGKLTGGCGSNISTLLVGAGILPIAALFLKRKTKL